MRAVYCVWSVPSTATNLTPDEASIALQPVVGCAMRTGTKTPHVDSWCARRTLQLLRWLFFTVIMLTGFYPVMSVNADEIRPALLDIKEQNTGLFSVTWKVPMRGDRVLAMAAQLPASLELLGSAATAPSRCPHRARYLQE